MARKPKTSKPEALPSPNWTTQLIGSVAHALVMIHQAGTYSFLHENDLAKALVPVILAEHIPTVVGDIRKAFADYPQVEAVALIPPEDIREAGVVNGIVIVVRERELAELGFFIRATHEPHLVPR